MSTKSYEVLVTARTAVFVADAESQEQAYQFARDELSGLMDFDDVEMEANELTSDADIASSRRHANVRSEP